MRMPRRRGSRPSGRRRIPRPGPRCCGGSGRPMRSRTTRPPSRLAPRDEAALLGRAQALVALDRRADAADAYDALAEIRARSGKLADAVDAARRALELAEGRERRRTLERLIGRLRGSGIDASARAALERALRVLEGPKVAPPVRTLSPAEAAAMAAAAEAMDAPAPDAPPAAAPRSRGRPRSSAAPSRSRRTTPARIEWPEADIKAVAAASAIARGADARSTQRPHEVAAQADTEARVEIATEARSRGEAVTTAEHRRGGHEAVERATGSRALDRSPRPTAEDLSAEEDLLAEVDPGLEAMLAGWTRRSRPRRPTSPRSPGDPRRPRSRPAARHRARRPRPPRGGGA